MSIGEGTSEIQRLIIARHPGRLTMRLAILADIHGNLPALESVLATWSRSSPTLWPSTATLINGVPFSAEVVDRLRATDWAIVRGNHEFYLLDHGTERAVAGSDDAERWGQLHWLWRASRRNNRPFSPCCPTSAPSVFLARSRCA